MRRFSKGEGGVKIFGIDFTSRPGPRKPITCCHALLHADRLIVGRVERLVDFTGFEARLASPGAWIAGIDFPFSLPAQFLRNIGWPLAWPQYVARIADMDRAAFVALLTDYKRLRKAGDKEHRREIDERAGAISPMKLYGVPVGKMFFEGAPRLLRSGATVLPFVQADPDRIVVEAYPALVARRFVGRKAYKSDERSRQTTAQRSARGRIVRAISSDLDAYGLRLRLPDSVASATITDATGDTLDAVLCAIQAGWAYNRLHRHDGLPAGAEGWIADPALAQE